MPSSQTLEKAVWQWAETTDPADVNQNNVYSAYRLRLNTCKPNACRRNCKNNPLCINSIGERVWMKELEEKDFHTVDDANEERREEGEFVGLRNLGATCYLNTFLQVWFHNTAFQEAISQWQEPDAEFKAVDNMKEEEDNMALSICGHLQRLFALLKYTNRRYIDPEPFIRRLGLDTTQQQDASEFSKLFISLLEDSLRSHANPKLESLVQDTFSGTYSYVTKCDNCQMESRRPSRFYELDLPIKGHKDLGECMDEFLKEELLDKDNMYNCSTCDGKQIARRHIALETLPQVLNMQLLRFVFERTTGHKKKLNTYIQFPELLDMSQYVGKAAGSVQYELGAALIHRGPSAYSGHYIAHIKDPKKKKVPTATLR